MPEQPEQISNAHPKPKGNRPCYPEKGLVIGLKSTGDKLSIVAGGALADDELRGEAVGSIRVLVEQAREFLGRIDEIRDEEPDFFAQRSSRRIKTSR